MNNSLSYTELFDYLRVAFLETMLMWGTSIVISILLGIAIGLIIFATREGLFWENRVVNFTVSFLINIIRSIPFIILLVLLLPLTKVLIGTTIGPLAASVSISISSICFFARIVESSLSDVDKGVIEAGKAIGASNFTIIKEILFPEAFAGILRGITILAITILGATAMAGMVGGGGIGDLAIRYGYYRYQTNVMVVTSILLIILVQIVQTVGDYFAKKAEKK
jgi:D-methionine transport system permease protein